MQSDETMNCESDPSHRTSDSETPVALTMGQVQSLLRDIIAEALDVNETLKPDERYTAEDFGYALQITVLGIVETLTKERNKQDAMLADFMTGGTLAVEKFVRERTNRLSLH